MKIKLITLSLIFNCCFLGITLGQTDFELCIASGSGSLTAFGRSFEQDNTTAHPTRTNGKVYAGYNMPITGTTAGSGEELLFQKEIYGGAGGSNPSFSYDIPVLNGFYMVDLYFAEVFQDMPSERVFDVSLEGNVILDEYDMMDPIKDGLTVNQTAITRTYYVEVTDGELNVFIGPASVDNGKLSGLCVTGMASANLLPVTNIGDLTATAGQLAALPLNIVDPESDVLTATFNGLPTSLSFNPTTLQLEGTPTQGDAGSHTINAIISDGTSAPITEEFILKIGGDDPPVVTVPADVNVLQGVAAVADVTVTDDGNNPTVTVVLYDKSNSSGSTNNPIEPNVIIPNTDYTFTAQGNDIYQLNWPTTTVPGRSYLVEVTADDGLNDPVVDYFSVNIAQDFSGTILAKTFAKPLPWYGNNPQSPFTVAIETNTNQNIGWIDNGEFVEYLINIPVAGTYTVDFLAAKGNSGTTTVTISEGSGGTNQLGSFTVAQSDLPDRWQNYQLKTVDLTFTNPGVQVLHLHFSGGVNILNFSILLPTAPIALADFTAKPHTEQSVMLDWITSSEENNEYFSIEHSTDGLNFESIDIVEGALNSTVMRYYSYEHKDASRGNNYYRLRQVDTDGTFSFSPIEVVRIASDLEIKVLPTLAENFVTISVDEAFDADVDVEIYDVLGRLVLAQTLGRGDLQVEISVSDLKRGQYFIRVNNGTETKVARFIKR